MFMWPGSNPLVEQSVEIAMGYLERSGDLGDPSDAYLFLAERIEAMMVRGQRNKLVLANRAIADFQRYSEARTIELTLTS